MSSTDLSCFLLPTVHIDIFSRAGLCQQIIFHIVFDDINDKSPLDYDRIEQKPTVVTVYYKYRFGVDIDRKK